MAIFDGDVQRVHALRHGGCEVLRIVVREPTGESVAEAHVRALCAALEQYAREALLRVAAGELLLAVREGRGFGFLRHAYTVSFSAKRVRRAVLCRVWSDWEHNGVRNTHSLTMRWTLDGSAQLGKGRFQRKTLAF